MSYIFTLSMMMLTGQLMTALAKHMSAAANSYN